MQLLISGHNGFIGKNLCLMLKEKGYTNIIRIEKKSTDEELEDAIQKADFIFHLAGVNRPDDPKDFSLGNTIFTKKLLQILKDKDKKTPILFSSTTKAEENSEYGVSKKKAEELIVDFAKENNSDYFIFRLPNVFGKWSKPNYNSFVSTFCHNIANDLEIRIDDPQAKVSLVYIDNVCEAFINILEKEENPGFKFIPVTYTSTVGEIAEKIQSFRKGRGKYLTEEVGLGLDRALYSTYISYYQLNNFSYPLITHEDERGVFGEFLKTKNSGQFSFFTAHPGITRGGHYHHTKNEKFLVLQGKALFKFEHVVTGEKHQITIESKEFKIIETIPGWSHDITNIGQEEMIVMLWANEIFDSNKPDTFLRPLL